MCVSVCFFCYYYYFGCRRYRSIYTILVVLFSTFALRLRLWCMCTLRLMRIQCVFGAIISTATATAETTTSKEFVLLAYSADEIPKKKRQEWIFFSATGTQGCFASTGWRMQGHFFGRTSSLSHAHSRILSFAFGVRMVVVNAWMTTGCKRIFISIGEALDLLERDRITIEFLTGGKGCRWHFFDVINGTDSWRAPLGVQLKKKKWNERREAKGLRVKMYTIILDV